MKAHRDFGRFRGSSEAEFVSWLRQILAANLAGLVRRYLGTQRRNLRLERQLSDELEQSSRALDRGRWVFHKRGAECTILARVAIVTGGLLVHNAATASIPQSEVNGVKARFVVDPSDLGIGLYHPSTGETHLSTVDSVGGHDGLAIGASIKARRIGEVTMLSQQPILPEDRVLVELLSKKLALLVLDTLALGIAGCRFGVPKPQDFLTKRQMLLDALAVSLRCVIVSPSAASDLVSTIHGSSERLVSVLHELFQDLSALTNWNLLNSSLLPTTLEQLSQHTRLLFDMINRHLQLVGSHVSIDPKLLAKCQELLDALPVEFVRAN